MKPVSRRLREALIRKVAQKRIPVKVLAQDAPCNERTIRNFLNGASVKDDTIRKICGAAGIDFDQEVDQRGGTAKSSNLDHGSYSQELVQDYIGAFYAYRRSFSSPGNLLRSLYQFDWDKNHRCLRFREFQSYQSARLQRRVKYDQEGDVFISNTIGLVHLLTVERGALRLVTLTRLHHDENIMRGLVLTQAEWPDHYQRKRVGEAVQALAG